MTFVNPFAGLTGYGFESGAGAVLRFLQDRLGFGLWMVTRTVGADWVVLQVEDKNYGVQAGKAFRWADSYCSQMVEGRGPRIAPQARFVPAYAGAPINQLATIGAYVGVPLVDGDGKLFGTLCAIDPAPQPESITLELPLIELLASLLSGLLAMELKGAEAERRAERAQAEADTDAMTGLCNRRAWDHRVTAEEARCQRYGHPACVVVVDINGLKAVNDSEGHAGGDLLLRRTADSLRSSVRGSDVVARLGGDEFAVLGIECTLEHGEAMLERLRKGLAESGISAAFGLAMRSPAKGIAQACEQADREMYIDKAKYSGSRFASETVFSGPHEAPADCEVVGAF